MGADKWDLDLKADVEVIALEFAKVILKVVEFREEPVFTGQIDGGPLGVHLAGQQMLPGAAFVFALAQIEAGIEGAVDEIPFTLVFLQSRHLGLDFDAAINRNADLRSQLMLKSALPAFELHNPLFGARCRKLCPRDFDGQLQSFSQSLA